MRTVAMLMCGLTIGLAVCSMAHADGGKVEVGGDVDMTTMIENQVAIAQGNGAIAVNENNRVSENVKIKGSLTMNTQIQNQVAAATGNNAKACNLNNVIGKSDCGSN